MVYVVVLLVALAGCRTSLDSRQASFLEPSSPDLEVLSRLSPRHQPESDQATASPPSDVNMDGGDELPSQNAPETGVSLASFEQENTIGIGALSLQAAIELAIENSDFITDNANFLSSGNPLLNDPQFVQSRFDLELQRASQQSVEAALAHFDAQLATGFQWGRNSVLQANSNVFGSDLLINDNSNFYGRLDQPLATGALASIIHNLNYANSSQSFPQDPRYTGFLRGEFRQPMWAGRGRRFTEIAGPASYRSRTQNHGVAMAEVAERIAELELEMGLAKLLKQTEEMYWDHWLAQVVFENQFAAAENAKQIWARTRNRAETGLDGGSAADEAQAEENYHRRKAIADSAAVDLEQTAARLRHITGLSDQSGETLTVSDSPAEVPFLFDVDSSVANGLERRSELKKQDLKIQLIENQLCASRMLQRPQFDLVSGIQFNGLGDDLFDRDSGAYPDLIDTDDFGWNVGFEFSMPLGFKRERLNSRYLNLLLLKAQTARCQQEKEIQLEIAHTARSVDKWNLTLNSTINRLAAAQRRRHAVEADFQAGRANLDLLLRSQDAVAEAKVELARATAELTKAQVELLFRQGITNFSQ